MNYSRENLILQNGLIVLTTKDTFFWKYFDDWIVTYKQNEVRPVTLQKYYIANQVIKELWPKVKISDITRELYQQLINLYGNKKNFAIENLAAVTRAESMYINHMGLHFDNTALSKTGMLIARVMMKIKEKGK